MMQSMGRYKEHILQKYRVYIHIKYFTITHKEEKKKKYTILYRDMMINNEEIIRLYAYSISVSSIEER